MEKDVIVAVDVDEVLALNAQRFVQFSNNEFGTSLTVEQYDENWSRMWNVDHDTAVERAKVWFAAELLDELELVEGSVETLTKLSEQCTLVIATSRRIETKAHTTRWIERHFGNIFKNIYFSGVHDSYDKGANERTKADLCRKIGAHILIDDQVRHCIGAAEIGTRAVLFGDYEWSKDVELHENIARATDWNTTYEQVTEWF